MEKVRCPYPYVPIHRMLSISIEGQSRRGKPVKDTAHKVERMHNQQPTLEELNMKGPSSG